MRKSIRQVEQLMHTLREKLGGSLCQVCRSERGDVPGWVLITVMTAGLVVAIWSIAGPELKSVLSDALRSVTTP